MDQMAQVPAQIVELLASDQAVFGIFSGDHTPEQGAAMATKPGDGLRLLLAREWPLRHPGHARLHGRSGERRPTRPTSTRSRSGFPPSPTITPGARSRIEQGVGAGVAAIVVPHVENAEQAALAVEAIGSDGWPANPEGRRTNILIIEDKEAIPNARAIASTPGVGVVIPGPGDLRRSFEGDMEAVEAAIQEVLAICLELNVACGITAGPDDIGTRLEQGFRMIIVTSPEALAVGRAAAGRSD